MLFIIFIKTLWGPLLKFKFLSKVFPNNSLEKETFRNIFKCVFLWYIDTKTNFHINAKYIVISKVPEKEVMSQYLGQT